MIHSQSTSVVMSKIPLASGGIAEHTNKYEEEIGENDKKLAGLLYELNKK